MLDLTQLQESVHNRSPEKTVDELAAALVPRELAIDIKYISPDGVTNTATVINKILSGEERTKVGRLTASLLQSSWEATPPLIRTFCTTLAWIMLSIDNRPKWLDRWMQEDETLLYSIYEEVQRHERRYFRGDDNEGSAPETEQRVFVTSKVSTEPAGKSGKPTTVGS